MKAIKILLCLCFIGLSLYAKEEIKNYDAMTKDELLVQLKKTKEKDYTIKKDIYKELFKLDPKNSEYRDNFVKYQKQSNALSYLEKLKTTRSDDLEERKKIYESLVNAFPENKEYKAKLDKYTNEFKKEEDKEKIELALIGERPIMNNWDGSYLEVKQYLKKVMNDPSSLEFVGCTKVYRMKGKGWLVGCQYRGNNAYGAKVLNANWFTIIQRNVVNVEPYNAYSLQ